jgi:hypothetical protein
MNIILIFYCNTVERYSTKGDEGKEDNKDILLRMRYVEDWYNIRVCSEFVESAGSF